MTVKSAIHGLHFLEGLNLSSFEEEKAVQLWLQNIQILEYSLCNCFDLLGVLVGDKDKIDPQTIATHDRQSLKVECSS
jgi:hypothetical protein